MVQTAHQGFVLWSLLMTMSIFITCLGLYTMVISNEYRDSHAFQFSRDEVGREVVSCTDLVLRGIAGRMTIVSGTDITATCRVISTTPTTVTILVKNRLYATTTVIAYSLDQITGQVVQVF